MKREYCNTKAFCLCKNNQGLLKKVNQAQKLGHIFNTTNVWLQPDISAFFTQCLLCGLPAQGLLGAMSWDRWHAGSPQSAFWHSLDAQVALVGNLR